jgi:hypothetical protein
MWVKMSHMMKNFIVAGMDWVAWVDLTDCDYIPPDKLQMEAATRAVEALYGKRDDVPISKHKPIQLTAKQKKQDELHAALIDLLTDELEEGCGIGMLLCVMDDQDPETYKKGENHEWYISSKAVLENVSIPKLINRFNEKYPNTKSKSI